MNKIKIILFLLIFFKLSVYSQSDFVPGYVQTTINDTLYGLIDYQGDKTNKIECRFRKTLNDTIHTFSPSEIYAYRFTNSKYYVSRQIKTEGALRSVFLEYLVEGVVDLYFYRDIKGDHYLVGKQNLPVTEISLPTDIVQVNEKGYKRSIRINWNVLKFYLKDCPEIYADIDQLTNTQHKQLIQLIKKYHDIHCPNDLCLIYQKELPKFRVDIQPFVGLSIINYSGIMLKNEDMEKIYKDCFQFGILSYFWLPLTNERLFFKTGIIINRLKIKYWGYEDNTYKIFNLLKVPLQLHYQFLKTNVTPVISAGVNIYTTPSVLLLPFPTMSLGINAKISDKISANLSTDFEYWSKLLIIPTRDSQFISFSFNLGFVVKF